MFVGKFDLFIWKKHINNADYSLPTSHILCHAVVHCGLMNADAQQMIKALLQISSCSRLERSVTGKGQTVQPNKDDHSVQKLQNKLSCPTEFAQGNDFLKTWTWWYWKVNVCLLNTFHNILNKKDTLSSFNDKCIWCANTPPPLLLAET